MRQKIIAAVLTLFATGPMALQAQSAQALGNGTIAAMVALQGRRLGKVVLTGKGGTAVATLPEAFTIKLGEGLTVKASDFAMAGAPVLSASGAGTRAAGKQLCFPLTARQNSLVATWCLVQPADAHFIRQELTLKATARDVPASEVTLLEFMNADARVIGSVAGSPIVAGNVYFGFEHPLSHAQAAGGMVQASMARTLPLRAGTSVAYSSVIGVAAPGQMRRDFQAYIERVRPRAYAPFLHYNSWYDLGFGQRFGEAGALNRIHAFGDELTTKRGVKLDSFLFDDGWDDTHSLWGFDSGFPDGFTKARVAAAQYKAGVGAWLSPWGGYSQEKKERIAFGTSAGYEIIDGGYALSGPRYFAAFQKRCLEMIDKYGVNQFKFDGTGNANHVFPGSVFDSDFEAAIALIQRLRQEEPGLFVNLTTGTTPSPFWLRYADSTWRGGEDNDFAGVGTWRQRWMTYRDATTYRNIVQAGPLYPLNSLMLHGILWAKQVEHLETDPGHDFSSEVWSYFGSGTQLQEMYVTPSLLGKADWDTLATAANWSRANQAVLRDVHWLGGDPGKLAVYGWAAWSRAKSIVVLRNPADHAQTFTLEVGSALELPPDAVKQFDGHAVAGKSLQSFSASADKPVMISLQPFEVRVMELLPTPQARTRDEQTTLQRLADQTRLTVRPSLRSSSR